VSSLFSRVLSEEISEGLKGLGAGDSGRGTLRSWMIEVWKGSSFLELGVN
jgi:hypothetical protein